MTPLEKILSLLPDATKSGNGWTACCPAHEDSRASLSISEGDDGRALIHCFAGCPVDAICDEVGLQPADLFPNRSTASTSTEPRQVQTKPGNRRREAAKPQGRAFATYEEAVAALERRHGPVSASWTYHDAAGVPVGINLRWDLPDGTKDIRPVSRHADGWRLGGMPDPRPLYRLPELANADRVYVCEGEKAADAARSIGLTATTSAHGSLSAAQTDWGPLAGKAVVILPDHDAPGQQYAEAVTGILSRLAPPAVVKVVELPELPDKGDIFDWVKAQGDAVEPEELRARVEEMAATADVVKPSRQPKKTRTGEVQSEAVIVRLSDVTEEPLAWLWPGRIPLGKLTLLAGDPGLGKSFVTIDMASRVSTGSPWPDCPGVPQPIGTVVLFNCEDDVADTVLPRLKQAGGNPSRVIAIEGIRTTDEHGNERTRGFSLDRDLPDLIRVVESHPDTRLVVIDPISAYCGSTDSHKNADVRRMLAPLAQMASQHRVAVVMVTHLSKGAGGKAVYRAMGSLAFAAAARAVWHVAKDHDDEQRRLILLAKMNVSEESTGLAYRLTDGVVCWEESPVTMTADEHLETEDRPKARTNGSGEEVTRGVSWLTECLSARSLLSSSVTEMADDADFSPATLKLAKKSAGVKSQRIGFGPDSAVWWTLSRPPNGISDPTDFDDPFP